MSTTYTWSIKNLTCIAQHEGHDNVVDAVFYECTGTTESDSFTFTGISRVPFRAGNFIPFDQLTEQQVMSWLTASGVDRAVVEASVQRELDRKKIPPMVMKSPPWTAA